ncbi:Hermansky-Pudlak syndrome 5 [Desmophyllum pertusum]|uniref:Hermansky-Pudlak syndrome 5 protein homolog n=1 Tax=Desmophyllum pertusum TaxID=174260 RepID=A0A9X0CNW0_9CNID|nr:Hermansky-Pudlak syndrome 5 [Desmophyllum pertusum]
MAAEGDVRWSSVVGEYGVLLTEMGSMEDLRTPIKQYPRIKYTCMTANMKYIAMGSSTGGLYIFDKKTLKHLRFISNKDGPIHAVCFTQRRSLLGVATSLGIVLVWEVSSRHRSREKPKFIRRSEEHKNATVTALCWDEEEARLFIGDVKGVVSVVHVPAASKLPHSVNKGFSLLHTGGIVAKAHTGIAQLDCVGDKLLVSTLAKCAIVDLKSLDCVAVGVKLRDGLYGSCFFKEGMSDSPTIYSARPGSRLWEASIDGQVMSTQQYKKLLGTPPVPILGHGHGAVEPITEGDFPPQSVNFAKLLLVRDRFLVTWHGTSLYIMDPILGQLVAWYAMETVILDIVCVGEEFYVYDCDDSVKWFALLSIKECVPKLFEMGEISQTLKVLLSCKHYIIPGSARDLVPVSLVANIRESLCEEDKEDKEDLIVALEELERDMEPATEVSDNPPNYHGNTSLADSPDTLSVCSDVFTDDLELNASGRNLETGDDNDNLSTTHSDDGFVSKGGLHIKKVKKQWSADISFEGMLMSAAAAAKKFKTERQKGNNKLKRSQSVDSPGGGVEITTDPHHEVGDSLSKVTAGGDTGQHVEGQETIQEEESPLLQKKVLEQSPCHSDDSESRQSGNEGGVAEEEASDKREKLSLRDKKKRKKRVVTVDIDSPQVKQDVLLGTPASHGRSSSFRVTYSSTEDTEVRNRRLLKKKLKAPSEDLSPLPSPTPPPEEEILDNTEDESQKIKCPPEVEELIQCSAKTRNEVKNPLVLFSISSLCRAFEEWIPKLHGATKSCLELNKNTDDNNTKIDLKYFLDGPAFADVSYLARMCFDCGVYGLEGMESFQDVFCHATSSSETLSSGSLVVQDNAEVTDVKDDISNVLESNASETVMEHEVDECTPSHFT